MGKEKRYGKIVSTRNGENKTIRIHRWSPNDREKSQELQNPKTQLKMGTGGGGGPGNANSIWGGEFKADKNKKRPHRGTERRRALGSGTAKKGRSLDAVLNRDIWVDSKK